LIPKDFITEWRDRAPWVLDRQVEQDLVISRALVELFSLETVTDALAFRGGTALHKLHFRPAARYSEDIDLVQTRAGSIGPVMDAIHDALDPWLGKPKWKQTEGRVTLDYRFDSEDAPPVALKLKVEINSREHFTVHGLHDHASRSPRAGSPELLRSAPTSSTSSWARSFVRSTSARRGETSSTLDWRSTTTA